MSKETWLDTVDATIHRAMRWIEVVLGVALLVTIGLNFINVVGRYVFSKSVLGIDEVQVYTMVWMTFVGAAAVTLRGENLRMDALMKAFPPWLLRGLRAIELALLFGLACFVIWVSASYAASMLSVKSTVGQIPMAVPHSSVVVGYALIALVVLRHALRGGRP